MVESRVASLGAAIVVCFAIFFRRLRRERLYADGSRDVPYASFTMWPIIGHLLEILRLGKDNSFYGVARVAVLADQKRQLGIVKIRFGNVDEIVVIDPDLITEVFKRNYQAGDVIGKNFDADPLSQYFKPSFGHGLFTASDHQREWGIAHRILTKPFSRQNMMSFVPLMNEQANRMATALERDVGFGKLVNIYDYTQKMAVETICVCAMGLELGSFENITPHPFIVALNGFLSDLVTVGLAPLDMPGLLSGVKRRMRNYERTMKEIVIGIIKMRRAGESKSATQFPDLLDCMLSTPDSETGEQLSEDSIRYNIMTFLLAGQDSTAASLGSFFCFLAAKPRVEAKLVHEIQAVVGNGEVTWQHLSKMKYLDWTQKETLRLLPPVANIPKYAYEDTILGGKWRIPKGSSLGIYPLTSHCDPKVWGDDAWDFVPERWEKGAPHTNAYTPFSAGPRGCIGREFTLLEQKLCVVKMLQRFIFSRPAEPPPPTTGRYVQKTSNPFPVLSPKVGWDVEFNPLQAFTGCSAFLELAERPKLAQNSSTMLEGTGGLGGMEGGKKKLVFGVTPENHGTPLLILYGSDGGSTAIIAEEIMSTAESLGFEPRLAAMDDLADSSEVKSGDAHVLIVTATYNGCPPGNAVNFVSWLNSAKAIHERPLDSKMRYAVLGIGNSQWEATFQAIPILVDDSLAEMGGSRILPLGTMDMSGDAEGELVSWHNIFWPTLCSALTLNVVEDKGSALATSLPPVEVVPPGAEVEPVILSYEQSGEYILASTVENRELQKPGGAGSTRHIQFELGRATYQAGDHLGVFPENDPVVVEELMARMGLSEDTLVRWIGQRGVAKLLAPLADGKARRLSEVLRRSVDLMKPATSAAVQLMGAKNPNQLEVVQILGFDGAAIQKTKVTVLELLQLFPSTQLTIPELLAILPVMQRRFYSISSSPLALSGGCTITVGVVAGKSPTGREHNGVCSNYLSRAKPGTKLWVQVKDTGSSFRLPSDSKTPLILIGPGTGLAPLRGFLQDIRSKKAQGVEIGAVHLFFGCQTVQKFLYEDELRALEADGTLASLNVAFSRAGGTKEYVQDHIARKAMPVWEVLCGGGHVYVCGDASKMAPDVRRAIKEIVRSEGDLDETKAKGFVDQLCAPGQHQRYHEDVWAS